MDKFKQIVIDAGNELVKRSLTVGTWGNISVRDSQSGYIFITPSGMNYDTCECSDIVVFDKDGNHVQGTRRPSIEKDLHIFIYQKRPDVNAVVHTHPMYSTVFAVTGQGIPAVTEEFAQIIGNKILCAEYALPGTIELAKNTVEALGEKSAVLLTSHGAVSVGESIEMAFKVSDVLEKAAQILIMSKSIGVARVIPDDEVKIMQDFVANQYGQK
ncbi:class II aldolase/adducin family protein [Petroclostridium sp. X23]|uniref:class II aldolase/adducin family protein n=1 Tax=Petroclostridium sp. X23 TaxID=3045146 RepID=UPI0024AC94AF|nr:class II aldolase/adducin family protein [Petroclostridium sp. X23]WHH58062.1 class II aldolase/adducin family protein [Petroclostridium sp. X23]